MDNVANSATASQTNSNAQRRQVTVLFADMVGYTALAETLGEENTFHLMQGVHKALNEAVHRHSGTVQEITGDGIMALFGAPIAIENAPIQACRAALDIQTGVAQLGEETFKNHGVRPAYRVGIHSGPLVVGTVGDDKKSGVTALGDTVNLAARIEAQASSGEICLSEATFRLVEGFADCSYMGEREIKGKNAAQALWKLDAIKSDISNFDVARDKGLTSFVGRKPELTKLEAIWEKARAGEMRSVVLVGDAGIGKSRLVHEFRERCVDDRSLFLRGHCDPGIGGRPFAPLVRVIRESFRLREDASTPEATDKLRRGMDMLGLDPDETLPYLLHLLGHPDESGTLQDVAHETLGIRIRDAILNMLTERCRISPTVIHIDGIHHADAATQDLLERCHKQLADEALLIVTTSRATELQDWAKAEYVHRLDLLPMQKRSIAELMCAKLKIREVSADLTDMIYEKTQGNPLFVESILESFEAAGMAILDDGSLHLPDDMSKLAIPSTIESLLMDRFDELEEGAKAMLELCAACGTHFDRKLLQASYHDPDAAEDLLEGLVENGLLQTVPGDRRLHFSQTLARDAIYDSLLTPHRQALHKKIAEGMEKDPSQLYDDGASQLAYHWLESDETERAVRPLAKAGEDALRVYALEEADRFFSKALDLVGDPMTFEDPDLVADIVLSQARVTYFSIGYYKIIALEKPYLSLFEKLSDHRRLARFLFEIGYSKVLSVDAENGLRDLARAEELGKQANDDISVAYAKLGQIWYRGQWRAPGEESTQQQFDDTEWVVKVGRENGDIWLASKALLALANDRLVWGDPKGTREAAMRMSALSRETNDPRPRAMGFWMMAGESVFSGDYEAAIEQADESLRISLSPIDRKVAESIKGTALVFSHRAVEGCAIGVPATARLIDGGNVLVMLPTQLGMDIGRILVGEMDAGLKDLKARANLPVQRGQTAPVPVAEMLLGEVYTEIALGTEKPDFQTVLRNLSFVIRTLPFAKSLGRKHLNRSIKLCREYDMKAHVARGLMNLAKLDLASRKDVQAQEHLMEARELAQIAGASGVIKAAEAELAKIQ